MSRLPPYIEGRGRHIDYNMKGNPVYEFNIVRGGIVQPPTHAGMEAYGLEERLRTEEQRRLLASLREVQQRNAALASGGAPGSGMNATAQLTLKIFTLISNIENNMHFNRPIDIEKLQNIQTNLALIKTTYEVGLAYDPITNFFEGSEGNPALIDSFVTGFNVLGFTVSGRKLFVELLDKLFKHINDIKSAQERFESATTSASPASGYLAPAGGYSAQPLQLSPLSVAVSAAQAAQNQRAREEALRQLYSSYYSNLPNQPFQPIPAEDINVTKWKKWLATESAHLLTSGSVPNTSFETYMKWRTEGGRRSKSRKNKNKNKRRSKSKHRRSRR